MQNQLFHYAKLIIVTGYYLLVAFPLVVSAAVTLQWDATDTPSDGYNLFQRVAGQSYNYAAPINTQTITQTSYSAKDLDPGVTYYFVVRAMKDNTQSGDSNEVEYTEPASTNDSDGDGIDDTMDAFPADPNEWADTDGDGTGDNQDADDDGDGMPDSYESGTEGLDPLVDDADGDLDGDNVSNKDEYDNSTDPTQSTNYLPDTPELNSPIHQSTVSLMPLLETQAFSDANGDGHAATRYQIALNENFTELVFDRLSVEHLTRFNLINLILDPETTYFWRVKFIDDDNGESDWSLPLSFTTVDYIAAGDQDANGILDSQEVADMSIDLDGDQVPDATQSNLLCVNTSDGVNPHISVKGSSPGIEIVALQAVVADGHSRALSLNTPDILTGLINFKLYLVGDINTASIDIYFTTEAPEDAQFYFNTENGWVAYNEVVFSSDRQSVTITLEDGGDGDQDGVENGVIVDPAGLGYSSQGLNSGSFEVTEQTTCFIATPLDDISGNAAPLQPAIVWGLFGLGCMLLLQFRRS